MDSRAVQRRMVERLQADGIRNPRLLQAFRRALATAVAAGASHGTKFAIFAILVLALNWAPRGGGGGSTDRREEVEAESETDRKRVWRL